jgi:chaperonin GroES
MKIKPLQDWVLIQRIEPKEMTAAGIIIPDSAKDKPTEGIVLAIGPGKFETEKGEKKEKEKKKKFIPTVLKPGQKIIYGKYSAREFELDREMIVLVREEDVLGTVEETRIAEKKPFAVAEKQENPLTVKKKQTAKKPLAKGKTKPKK